MLLAHPSNEPSLTRLGEARRHMLPVRRSFTTPTGPRGKFGGPVPAAHHAHHHVGKAAASEPPPGPALPPPQTMDGDGTGALGLVQRESVRRKVRGVLRQIGATYRSIRHNPDALHMFRVMMRPPRSLPAAAPLYQHPHAPNPDTGPDPDRGDATPYFTGASGNGGAHAGAGLAAAAGGGAAAVLARRTAAQAHGHAHHAPSPSQEQGPAAGSGTLHAQQHRARGIERRKGRQRRPRSRPHQRQRQRKASISQELGIDRDLLRRDTMLFHPDNTPTFKPPPRAPRPSSAAATRSEQRRRAKLYGLSRSQTRNVDGPSATSNSNSAAASFSAAHRRHRRGSASASSIGARGFEPRATTRDPAAAPPVARRRRPMSANPVVALHRGRRRGLRGGTRPRPRPHSSSSSSGGGMVVGAGVDGYGYGVGAVEDPMHDPLSADRLAVAPVSPVVGGGRAAHPHGVEYHMPDGYAPSNTPGMAHVLPQWNAPDANGARPSSPPHSGYHDNNTNHNSSNNPSFPLDPSLLDAAASAAAAAAPLLPQDLQQWYDVTSQMTRDIGSSTTHLHFNTRRVTTNEVAVHLHFTMPDSGDEQPDGRVAHHRRHRASTTQWSGTRSRRSSRTSHTGRRRQHDPEFFSTLRDERGRATQRPMSAVARLGHGHSRTTTTPQGGAPRLVSVAVQTQTDSGRRHRKGSTGSRGTSGRPSSASSSQGSHAAAHLPPHHHRQRGGGGDGGVTARHSHRHTRPSSASSVRSVRSVHSARSSVHSAHSAGRPAPRRRPSTASRSRPSSATLESVAEAGGGATGGGGGAAAAAAAVGGSGRPQSAPPRRLAFGQRVAMVASAVATLRRQRPRSAGPRRHGGNRRRGRRRSRRPRSADRRRDTHSALLADWKRGSGGGGGGGGGGGAKRRGGKRRRSGGRSRRRSASREGKTRRQQRRRRRSRRAALATLQGWFRMLYWRKVQSANAIQAMVRGRKVRRELNLLRAAAARIQGLVRGFFLRTNMAAARSIQGLAKVYLARLRAWRRMYEIQFAQEARLASAIVVQRVFRGFYVRSWLRYQTYHALLIQDTFRDFRDRKHGARHLQRLWRGHCARVEVAAQRASIRVQTRARQWLAARALLRARRLVENKESVRRGEEEMTVRAARAVLAEEMGGFLATKKGKAQIKAEAASLRAGLDAKIASVKHKPNSAELVLRFRFETFDVERCHLLDRAHLRMLLDDICVPATEEEVSAALYRVNTGESPASRGIAGIDDLAAPLDRSGRLVNVDQFLALMKELEAQQLTLESGEAKSLDIPTFNPAGQRVWDEDGVTTKVTRASKRRLLLRQKSKRAMRSMGIMQDSIRVLARERLVFRAQADACVHARREFRENKPPRYACPTCIECFVWEKQYRRHRLGQCRAADMRARQGFPPTPALPSDAIVTG